jgi:hypothetical protein
MIKETYQVFRKPTKLPEALIVQGASLRMYYQFPQGLKGFPEGFDGILLWSLIKPLRKHIEPKEPH